MSLITCKNLCLGYENRTILENLNFDINQGDYLCIVGENGSGKSTLMKTLLNLTCPVSGQIIVGDGLEKNQIGYLPQQSAIQKDFPASVEEIVLSGCLNSLGKRIFYGKKERDVAKKNMEKMEITLLAHTCYRNLSGGQQQRVLLARALCAADIILLLDEPVAGLDPNLTAQMYCAIEKLNREDKMTIVMISHDISAALQYADHILHIGKGGYFFGTKQEYLKINSGINPNFTQTGEANGTDK